MNNSMESTIYTVNGQEFELQHYGVKGMRWGHRKRNPFGSGGVKSGPHASNSRLRNNVDRMTGRNSGGAYGSKAKLKANVDKMTGGTRKAKADVDVDAAKRARRKKALAIGGAVVGTALAAYGAKKLHDVVRDKNEAIKLQKANKLIDEMIRGGTWNTPIGTSAATRAKIDKNFENYVTSTFRAARRDAARDSFASATRNVVNDYLDNRRRR